MTETQSDEAILQKLAAADAPAARILDVPANRQRVVFSHLPESVRQGIVDDMTADQLRGFVRRVDPDEAADILEYADAERREEVVQKLRADRREKVEFLLDFDPESAAGMMDLDYVTVELESGFKNLARRVRSHEEKTGRFPTIFVLDDGQLVGQLPGHTLGLDELERGEIDEYLEEAPAVRFDAPEQDVLEVFRAHPNRRLAVLDEDDQIMGVIHADDLLRAIDEQAGETLYEFTGVAEEESALDGPFSKVKYRYRWLLLNLATAFLAAAVVGLFEPTIDALPVLAAYMPIVAGMGGNAGTQTMAVTVRGLALEQVSLRTGGRMIFNEVLAGAANGALNGVLVALIASYFTEDPAIGATLGAVIGVSMIFNLVIAGFFGAIIPLILDSMDIDPATSATIFITTATDVLGFFVFLGLASMYLL